MVSTFTKLKQQNTLIICADSFSKQPMQVSFSSVFLSKYIVATNFSVFTNIK